MGFGIIPDLWSGVCGVYGWAVMREVGDGSAVWLGDRLYYFRFVMREELGDV